MPDSRYTYKDFGKWRIQVGDTEMCGPWVDRLAEYENLGMSAAEIRAACTRAVQFDQLSSLVGSDLNKLASFADRLRPRRPVKDSLADRGCPHCNAYINWDALNEPVKDAPKFCKNCGQEFDWSGEKGYEENAEYI